MSKCSPLFSLSNRLKVSGESIVKSLELQGFEVGPWWESKIKEFAKDAGFSISLEERILTIKIPGYQEKQFRRH